VRHASTFTPAPEGQRSESLGRAIAARRERETTKTCSKCGEEKPRDQFHVSRQGKFGPVLKSACKDCGAAAVREWYSRNSDQSNTNRRRLQLKQNYGLTVEQYVDMLEAQGNACAICHQPERAVHGNGTAFGLSVDHCHDSSDVRGLLCQRCNRAIGLLGDDVELLRSAIAYLLNPPARGLI